MKTMAQMKAGPVMPAERAVRDAMDRRAAVSRKNSAGHGSVRRRDVPVEAVIRPVGHPYLTGQPYLEKTASAAALKEARKSSNNDCDKFGLSTGSGFAENIFELSARRLVTDVKLARSGPQCFSCDEMKRQSGLRWRQPKVTM